VETQITSLKAQIRTLLGKKVKRLRKYGITPVNLYGSTIASMPLNVDTKQLIRVLSKNGRNQPISLEIDDANESHICFVRDIQFHPVTNAILHIDFFKVIQEEITQLDVPLELTGEAPASRNLGGSLVLNIHSVTIQAKPLDVPSLIGVDVSGLNNFEKVVKVGDLVAPIGVTIVGDMDQIIARVNAPRETTLTPGEPISQPEPTIIGEDEASPDIGEDDSTD